MKLRLERRYKKSEYTIGLLFIDGVFFCNTLEDRVREIKPDGKGKISGMTAIPAGTYRVVVNWSPRFRRLLPYVEDVPHFEGIRIHSGNTARDTDGCILVGVNDAVGRVNHSCKTLEALMSRLDGQRNVTIEIV